MDFSLNEAQELMKKAVRDFLKEECTKELVREMAQDEKGYSPQVWRKMAELGWQSFALPEHYGGEGGSFLDLTLLLEELGRALLPSPFFATVVLGGMSILEAGSEEQRKWFLPKVASGDIILTLAITEPGARYETDLINFKAALQQHDYILNGTKIFVPYAHIADYIICVTSANDKEKRDEGITNFIVNAKNSGITSTVLEKIGRDKQCELVFKDAVVPRQDILGNFGYGLENMKGVLNRATIGLCADMNGGIEQILETSVNYAKNRTQFGRPIGSFQAVQHRCADIAVGLEASRVLTYEAAWMISEGLPCTMEVSAAKAFVSDSYRQATWLSMQAQGGVSFFEDHELPLYYREAKATEVTLGDTDFHQEMIAHELLDWN